MTDNDGDDVLIGIAWYTKVTLSKPSAGDHFYGHVSSICFGEVLSSLPQLTFMGTEFWIEN